MKSRQNKKIFDSDEKKKWATLRRQTRNKELINHLQKWRRKRSQKNMTCDKASFVQLDHTRSVHSLKNLIFMYSAFPSSSRLDKGNADSCEHVSEFANTSDFRAISDCTPQRTNRFLESIISKILPKIHLMQLQVLLLLRRSRSYRQHLSPSSGWGSGVVLKSDLVWRGGVHT